MTTRLRDHGDAAFEARRFAASQAAREQTALDPRSVLLTIKHLIATGRTNEARALAGEYRRGAK